MPTEQEHPDFAGPIEMPMRVAFNSKLVDWIEEWLGDIAVLEPASLRDDVRAAALKGRSAGEVTTNPCGSAAHSMR